MKYMKSWPIVDTHEVLTVLLLGISVSFAFPEFCDSDSMDQEGDLMGRLLPEGFWGETVYITAELIQLLKINCMGRGDVIWFYGSS